jgi:ATP-dependent Clp protease ATP-binding subunit ClpX
MSGLIATPRQIAEVLGRRVLGQEEAVREVSVALAKKLAGLNVGNVLMIGSSGSGKTTIMRAVEAMLASNPELAHRSTVVRIHANVLGEAAISGRPGGVLLTKLLERAREQLGSDQSVDQLLQQVKNGLVFVDEIDKIRSHVEGEPNTTGIRAQEALLTLIENESVSFDLPEWAGGGTRTIDSSGLLFVCGGAFEGLYDSVFDRVTVGEDRGTLKPVTIVENGQVREELPFELRDWLRAKDLFDYGMSPQFLSRFDAMVLLETLKAPQLIKIFLEAPDSAYRHAVDFFGKQGIQFAISPAAVEKIAQEAVRQKRLGARALKEVFRRVIRDYEYDPTGKVIGDALMIDLPEVEAALDPNTRNLPAGF